MILLCLFSNITPPSYIIEYFDQYLSFLVAVQTLAKHIFEYGWQQSISMLDLNNCCWLYWWFWYIKYRDPKQHCTLRELEPGPVVTLNRVVATLSVVTFFWGWKRMMWIFGAKRQPSTTEPLRLTEMHMVVVCTWESTHKKVITPPLHLDSDTTWVIHIH